MSSGTLYSSISILGLPTSFTISSMNSTIFLISSCANMIASRIVSSGTSCAPASTIMIASFVPETTRCIVLASLCSKDGFTMNCPSTIPMRTEPVGPSHGISEIASATEDPIIAAISEGASSSTDMTVATTCTSLKKPFGNSGRSGLSIRRELRIAFSLGLPSLFINPPGIFPAAYIFSS